MAYDLLIKNGTVIDGTGQAQRHADVAVSQGKIVEIGKISGEAKRVIDASDLVVSPGFVDPHSHYDSQICWDTDISPTSWHGVTSVVLGNCGVGIAPCAPAGREVAIEDVVALEGIPYDLLKRGITWDWESFPEYMDAAERRGPAINLGFLAPLTPIRQYVMGAAAIERAATSEETQKIRALIKDAISAGALGFSTTVMKQHIGHGGKPLACRLASPEELNSYANVLKELGKGTLQIAVTERAGALSEGERDLLETLLKESGGRPITWGALLDRDDMPTSCQDALRLSESLRRRGVIPQIAAVPIMREFSTQRPFVFASCPTWHPVFNKSKEAQAAYFRDPAFRQGFREDLKVPRTFSGNWSRVILSDSVNPKLKPLEGMTIEEISRQRGVDGVDALLDITLEDNLDCEFTMAYLNCTEERLPDLLNAPNTLIGLADGGAHVDTTCDARYTTYLLGTWVRERGIMSLEKAVQKLTAEPADIFGMKDRGRLTVGSVADIVVFDPATVGCAARWEKRFDQPGGAKRLVSASYGVEYTFVNGTAAWENNALTGARAGRVIRT